MASEQPLKKENFYGAEKGKIKMEYRLLNMEEIICKGDQFEWPAGLEVSDEFISYGVISADGWAICEESLGYTAQKANEEWGIEVRRQLKEKEEFPSKRNRYQIIMDA